MADKEEKEIDNGSAIWTFIPDKTGGTSKVTVKDGFKPYIYIDSKKS